MNFKSVKVIKTQINTTLSKTSRRYFVNIIVVLLNFDKFAYSPHKFIVYAFIFGFLLFMPLR